MIEHLRPLLLRAGRVEQGVYYFFITNNDLLRKVLNYLLDKGYDSRQDELRALFEDQAGKS